MPLSLLLRLVPAGWPVLSLWAMSTGLVPPPDPKVGASAANAGKPISNTVGDHVGIHAGCFPKLIVAVLCWYYTVDIVAARELSTDWIAMIFVRDLIITFLTAGVWDLLLYSPASPLFSIMAPYKFNPSYPKLSQIVHDMFWSTCSTLISSAIEVAVLHAWAVSSIQLVAPVVWWRDTSTLLWILSMPYWRLSHFFFVHRFLLHKWGTTSIPDIGAVMYKYVHSLHHKSRNPTSWSGISMHPVEGTIYYTAMLIPVFMGAHPLIMLYTKMDLTMAALLGHDGFGAPSTGSQPHWLHHHLVQCNYGESFAPWDWLFGTYAATEEDFIAKFGSKSIEADFDHDPAADAPASEARKNATGKANKRR